MATQKNRFAILDLDEDSSDKEAVLVEQPPISVPLPIAPPPAPPSPARAWNLDEGRPSTIREWNLDKPTGHRRKGPFSRYAFRDEERPKVGVPRTYAFRDESPPAERRKQVSPTGPHPSPEPTPHPLPEETSLNAEEFPKLSDYSRPQTPPYPPDDGWYPTLAERIRLAMERKEMQDNSETKVIGMDTVIPVQTRFHSRFTL